jgi:D-alanyl-D-alanine carboxypeptidase (penicillin-binding protein 5/6)
VAFAFLCLLGILAPGWAQSDEAAAFETKALQAILIDAKSGTIMFEKDPDTPVPPASMSKLMTQAYVFDLLKKGELKPDQMFTVSEDAWRRGGGPSGGSTMYAELNSQVSLMDLLHGAIIQSANDACIVMAEGIAGSEAAFVNRINDRAKELGLTNSTLRNATGLPDPEHKMSVRDLATLARYIITEHSEAYKIYGKPEFTWNKITQQNRNPLLKDYPGADGMKTGYTKEAGYGLVGSAVRDGRRLIMVIAGLKTINERKAEAQKLLDWGFRQFKPVDVYEAGETVAEARVWGGTENWVDLVTPRSYRIALSPAEQQSIEVKLSYSGPLMAPVKKGETIGQVRLLVDGRVISELPVETAADVPAVDSMWQKAADSVLIMIFGG